MIMDMNHTKTKLTLRTAIENENHLCLSDSDSTYSDADKGISYSSPAGFHSNSGSGSPNSGRDKATTTTVVRDSRRSSISSDSDFTTVETDEVVSHGNTSSTTAKRYFTKTHSPPADSPGRSSISSNQISLPHASLILEDNKADSAAPTRIPPEKPAIPEAVVKRSIKEASVSTDHIWLPHESNKPDEAPVGNSPEKSPSPSLESAETLAVTKADLVVRDGGPEGGARKQRRRLRPPLSILRKSKMDEMVKKAALGFRVFGFLFCLVSFSVMAADRNQGWALDSFERYKEFRYCMSVNVMGFLYSGAQAFDLVYQSATGKKVVQHHLRYFFDFAFDQIVTYLLVSASSSAATRIDDWQLNWGKDKFPDMATASVVMSFLAFAALAFSSLISGYVLCNSKSA